MAKTNKKSYGLKTISALMVLLSASIGVGYAHWTDQIQTVAAVSTAKINPVFCGKFNIIDVQGSSRDLKISFDGDMKNTETRSDDEYYTMILENKLYLKNSNGNGSQYKGFLHYCIKNNGSIPIKFHGDNGIIQVKINGNKIGVPVVVVKGISGNEQEEFQSEISLYDGKLKLILNQPKKVLDGGEAIYNENAAPQIHIQAFKPGIYSFEIELPFVMKDNIKNTKEWSNKLVIKGVNLEVVPESN